VHTARRHHTSERHRTGRSGWLRASVLGANDGILSTGALLVGLAGAGADRGAVLTAGVAGLVAGAASMGIGEYVSVSTQSDVEAADRALETAELADDPVAETLELKSIYVTRGLPDDLAGQVAESLMATDPLGAHLRDELGHTEASAARPVQAAASSFGSFSVGAALPLAAAALAPDGARAASVVAATLIGLVLLGTAGAALGGAPRVRGALRVGIGGVLALALTFAVGTLLGTAVS
jgi:vacuolar iron transporter family protein